MNKNKSHRIIARLIIAISLLSGLMIPIESELKDFIFPFLGLATGLCVLFWEDVKKLLNNEYQRIMKRR